MDHKNQQRHHRDEDPNRSNSGTLLSKISTLGRKKKNQKEGQNDTRDGYRSEKEDEPAPVDLSHEAKEVIDSPAFLKQQEYEMDDGEQRRFMTLESKNDPRVREIFELLRTWLNQELAQERIVVRDLQEDLYDGQIIQKLIEKLANIRIEVPEVCQSEEGQKQKLQMIINEVNSQLGGFSKEIRWTAELIHKKDLLAIVQLLIQIALFYRAPIRFPEDVHAQVLVVHKENDHFSTGYQTEQLTTRQKELAPKGERDAFDTLFDYGPDKLAHVKSSLVAFCNRHLNKINLEVTDLDYQFQDGVFLILLMGLLEGYFVPLYSFHLQVKDNKDKIKNVEFAFFLMEEAGMARPKARAADIVNGDVKSTLRILHSLFTKYKHV
uniref:Paralyzed arrest at two-fold protein 6 (inferred by orthology to a C. elegans protein) n=1 Tax=Strongyloides venezuelensis TaxID=75913 RepID=A0A0K0G0J4_STRVS